MMTTHGRGGLSRLWLGSVADRFVRSSVHPVMLVKPTTAPAHPGPFEPRRIVVPLDGSPLAEAALPYATSLARAFGARLMLLRGLIHFGGFDIAHLSLNPKRLDAERIEVEAYLEERVAAVRRAGVEAETFLLRDPGLAEAIANRAEDDLIVMTTNGRGGLDRQVFGSVADKVVRSATCPVMVIRPTGRDQTRDLEELSHAISEAADSVAAPASDRG
jgi:nucleotide-binding universal stress UspA family protein